MKLQRMKSKPRFSKRSILKFLGLPFSARWEKAEPILKDRIVSARRNHDDDRAKMFSGIKAFLKRNLKRSCQICGKAIVGGSQRCQMHRWFKAAAVMLFITLSAAAQTNFFTTPVVATIGVKWKHPIAEGTNKVFYVLTSPSLSISHSNWQWTGYVAASNHVGVVDATNYWYVVTVPVWHGQQFWTVAVVDSFWGTNFFDVSAWTNAYPRTDSPILLQR